MKSKGKIAVGVACAFAAGITVGLLFAPRKGIKTRKRIMGAINDAMDLVNEKLSSAHTSQDDVEEKSKNVVEG